MTAEKISVGAFYNPHLAEEILASGNLIDHLAMADPPEKNEPYFPEVRKKFVLLLHDYIHQLSDPNHSHSIACARQLAGLYRSRWVTEQCRWVIPRDGRYSVACPVPPLYTREMLARYIE